MLFVIIVINIKIIGIILKIFVVFPVLVIDCIDNGAYSCEILEILKCLLEIFRIIQILIAFYMAVRRNIRSFEFLRRDLV